ncbi:MAG: alanine--tRNA ligase [Saprospiraceae bacterium]|nr:alanine--tRNA ligase [Saprospiraceae bacterium]
MDSRSIRQTFLEFFEKHQHKIVPSAPIVVKNDPTLMFTNAGMNQFKDYFLGNQPAQNKRIADSQKCLRVSGKHNDLEEVGTDGYHHTMFEMLGNWSFGDYFKEEAIEMAWKLLTEVYGLQKDRIYVSVFGGDTQEGLARDEEAIGYWKKWVDEERILSFGKKDNFWEMGDTGPCGPCSEIHYDIRSDELRKSKPGADLVNVGTPDVIEIWNLVFIQYNRKANGSLEELPDKHIDTGMGFERLAMVLQGKTASYDTDIFSPFIRFISEFTGITYKASYDFSEKSDLAMRVIADHIRAVCFAIADGSLPSNTGPGYVIRRILRRAVRYYYSFLGIKDPFLFRLVPILLEQMGNVYTELAAQSKLISNVLLEEEASFLRTLEEGLRKIEALDQNMQTLSGKLAFELYDTYGFPFDLTQLIAKENNWKVDEQGFHDAMLQQKERSRSDAKKEYSDWNIIHDGTSHFVGYDTDEVESTKLLRWRKLALKGQNVFQLVFETTPFYPEGGGQVGDKGIAVFDGSPIEITETLKENELILHMASSLPEHLDKPVSLKINSYRRSLIENNHSATHLLHAALRKVLGSHVQQRGSLVQDSYLRFDFSHFQKMDEESIAKVEQLVNEKIRENIARIERRSAPIDEAKQAGAMMLFGEKYGDKVRMITFDPAYSIELCGGCHVDTTGQIGFFKIISETAIAAGIRRIEAVTAIEAEKLIRAQFQQMFEIKNLLKNPNNAVDSIHHLLEENKTLQKQVQELKEAQAMALKQTMLSKSDRIAGIRLLCEVIPVDDGKIAKSLIYQIAKEMEPAIILFGFIENEKPQLMCLISEELTKAYAYNASSWVREIAKHIDGGGGGQAFFATAGGKNANGLNAAVEFSKQLIQEQISKVNT